MTLTAGTRLGSHEIVAPIGAGGMGEVYRARDLKLGRDVALKVLPADDRASSPERLARFQREARARRRAQPPAHRHDPLSRGVERRSHFLAMELVEGRPLDLAIAGGLALGAGSSRSPPRSPTRSAAAHEKGIIHRDLKPANVMVGQRRAGQGARLRSRQASTRPQARPRQHGLPTDDEDAGRRRLGTVPYMSPEQVAGPAVDLRTDIFSLGIILYEMADRAAAVPRRVFGRARLRRSCATHRRRWSSCAPTCRRSSDA